MKCKLATIPILVMIFSLFLSFFVFPAKADPIYVDSNIMFGFNNGWLNFNSLQVFTTIYETAANYWYFDLLGISLNNANATVLSWFTNNQVSLNLTSISGTATVLMDLSVLQTSPGVSGASASSFNATSGILNVTESSFTVQVITVSLSPIYITGFTVNNYDLAQNVPFYLSATVYDEWGTIALTSVNVELSLEYQITVAWSLGGFSIPGGSSVCSLDTSGCSVTMVDSYTYLIVWKLTFLGTQPEQIVSVLGAGTLASDAYGNTATNSLTDLATYAGVPSGPGPGPGPVNPPPYTPPTNPTNQTQPTPPTNQTQPENPNNQTGGYVPPENPFLPPLPEIPAVTAQIPFSPVILLVGVILIFGVVGVTGYYSGRRKNPLLAAQREWDKQNRGKSAKWNKED